MLFIIIEAETVATFEEFCSKFGIIHQTTLLYSSQSNGVAEWKNCTLKQIMNAMLINSDLLQNLFLIRYDKIVLELLMIYANGKNLYTNN